MTIIIKRGKLDFLNSWGTWNRCFRVSSCVVTVNCPACWLKFYRWSSSTDQQLSTMKSVVSTATPSWRRVSKVGRWLWCSKILCLAWLRVSKESSRRLWRRPRPFVGGGFSSSGGGGVCPLPWSQQQQLTLGAGFGGGGGVCSAGIGGIGGCCCWQRIGNNNLHTWIWRWWLPRHLIDEQWASIPLFTILLVGCDWCWIMVNTNHCLIFRLDFGIHVHVESNATNYPILGHGNH